MDTVCPAVGLAGVGAPAGIVVVALTVTMTSLLCAGVVAVPLVLPTPAVAVTFDVRLVLSVVVATPLASVVPTEGSTVPKSTVKETGTFGSALPAVSITLAEIVEE